MTAYLVTIEQRGRVLATVPCADQFEAVDVENVNIRFYRQFGFEFITRTLPTASEYVSAVDMVRQERTLNPLTWFQPRRERLRIRISKQGE